MPHSLIRALPACKRCRATCRSSGAWCYPPRLRAQRVRGHSSVLAPAEPPTRHGIHLLTVILLPGPAPKPEQAQKVRGGSPAYLRICANCAPLPGPSASERRRPLGWPMAPSMCALNGSYPGDQPPGLTAGGSSSGGALCGLGGEISAGQRTVAHAVDYPTEPPKAVGRRFESCRGTTAGGTTKLLVGVLDLATLPGSTGLMSIELVGRDSRSRRVGWRVRGPAPAEPVPCSRGWSVVG